ncbi:MAG TPA: sulfur transferase domain-containing protein [Gemmatimonadaceae bacterium]|nr:sulfur transferase domain-containing protein [Gemmatimonadaceae bacterium]
MPHDERALRAVLETIPQSACPVRDIATAGQPAEVAWRALADAGYRTVVDLRAADEPRGYDEPAAVRAAGLEYVLLPVTQATLSDETFDAFRTLVGDPARRPVLVHCATSNRVGALLLPYFALDEHRPLAESFQLAQAAGLRSPELAMIAGEYARRHGATG